MMLLNIVYGATESQRVVELILVSGRLPYASIEMREWQPGRIMRVKVGEETMELTDELRWQTLLSDPDSLAMLEEMANAALKEDDAGLTWELDELPVVNCLQDDASAH